MRAARVSSEKRESGSRSDGMTVAWNGIPEPATSSASWPRRPPMNRKRISGSVSLSASATARSGLTCPPVPPPTRSTLHARPLRRSGSTNVQEDTDGDQANTERAAAVRDEREGDPGHRYEARDDGHVHPCLEAEPDRDPGREQRSRRVLRTQRDPHAAEGEREEQKDDDQSTRQAELVTEHREDGIGVRMREVAELFLSGTKPLPERPAQSEGVEHLNGLKAEPLRVRPRIQECEEALVAVRLGDCEREHHHHGQGTERGELAQPRARREVDGESNDHHHDRGAQIRLGHDQPHHENGDQDEREADPPRADVGPFSAQPRRQVDDERELRELRRLQPERTAEPQPPRRAARALADAGDEDRSEEDDGEQEKRDRDEAQEAVVDPRRDEHRADAEGRPRRLLGEERARIVIRIEGRDPARAVHHREPDEEQDNHDRDERQVVAGRARQSQLHDTNVRTIAANLSPRSSADENMSNEAHAGESRTTSPAWAISRARATASSSVAAR